MLEGIPVVLFRTSPGELELHHTASVDRCSLGQRGEAEERVRVALDAALTGVFWHWCCYQRTLSTTAFTRSGASGTSQRVATDVTSDMTSPPEYSTRRRK